MRPASDGKRAHGSGCHAAGTGSRQSKTPSGGKGGALPIAADAEGGWGMRSAVSVSTR